MRFGNQWNASFPEFSNAPAQPGSQDGASFGDLQQREDQRPQVGYEHAAVQTQLDQTGQPYGNAHQLAGPVYFGHYQQGAATAHDPYLPSEALASGNTAATMGTDFLTSPQDLQFAMGNDWHWAQPSSVIGSYSLSSFPNEPIHNTSFDIGIQTRASGYSYENTAPTVPILIAPRRHEQKPQPIQIHHTTAPSLQLPAGFNVQRSGIAAISESTTLTFTNSPPARIRQTSADAVATEASALEEPRVPAYSSHVFRLEGYGGKRGGGGGRNGGQLVEAPLVNRQPCARCKKSHVKCALVPGKPNLCMKCQKKGSTVCDSAENLQ